MIDHGLWGKAYSVAQHSRSVRPFTIFVIKWETLIYCPTVSQAVRGMSVAAKQAEGTSAQCQTDPSLSTLRHYPCPSQRFPLGRPLRKPGAHQNLSLAATAAVSGLLCATATMCDTCIGFQSDIRVQYKKVCSNRCHPWLIA